MHVAGRPGLRTVTVLVAAGGCLFAAGIVATLARQDAQLATPEQEAASADRSLPATHSAAPHPPHVTAELDPRTPPTASLVAAGAAQPVERLAGADRVTTAVEVSASSWDEAPRVVLASAWGFPDALAATGLAAAHDAPVLLTAPASLPAEVRDELIRLRAGQVTVVGGPAAVDDAVVQALRRLPTAPQVQRIGGRDRYETAAEVAVAAGHAHEVLIASGTGFADALSAGSLTGGGPVLLSAPDALPDAAVGALASLQPEAVRILGGAQAVSDAVEAQVSASVPAVTRLAGPDRYRTALAAAEHRLADDTPARLAIVATGERFPDGLAAGALAAHLDAVVLLSPQRRVTDELDAFLRAHAGDLDGVVLVGGPAALGNHVEAEVAAALSGDPRPGFRGSSGPLPPDVRDQMTGVSWEPGCPVGLDDLALVELVHWDFSGQVRDGRMVVAGRVADDVLTVFERLFAAGFPITQVELVDAFGADDDRSMAANNTHGFNCRMVGGTDRWSEHAFGTAVDLNPVQNPFVRSGGVDPPAGADYLDRGDVRPGMIVRPGPAVEAFEAIGWGWGGDWQSSKDYHHFSESGR